jgi:hypothetical protein
MAYIVDMAKAEALDCMGEGKKAAELIGRLKIVQMGVLYTIG